MEKAAAGIGLIIPDIIEDEFALAIPCINLSALNPFSPCSYCLLGSLTGLHEIFLADASFKNITKNMQSLFFKLHTCIECVDDQGSI